MCVHEWIHIFSGIGCIHAVASEYTLARRVKVMVGMRGWEDTYGHNAAPPTHVLGV